MATVRILEKILCEEDIKRNGNVRFRERASQASK